MDPFQLDTIICPQCHVELPASAESCTACGTPTRDAPVCAESGTTLLHRPWVLAVLLLHLGLLGIPIYWKLHYSAGVRTIICLVSIVYTVFVVLAVWWGSIWIWDSVQSLK